MARYEALLAEFEVESQAAADVKHLMQQISDKLHDEMARYNWVGFYFMEAPAFNALVLGPYSGSFMPTLKIPLEKGLCGAAASSRQTVVVNDVSRDPRYLGSDLVKSNIVVPIFVNKRVAAELCIESYFVDTFHSAERSFIEACAGVVGSRMQTDEQAARR
jgi:L-methionine (R)-S-oxide reductase